MVPATKGPADTEAMVAMVQTATDGLLRSVARLDDDGVAAPSLMPGWTRGHVLAHLARNADALRNLLAWARTGVETPMYRSRQVRDEEIESGAGRSAEQHRADLAESHRRFMAAAAELTEADWGATVRWGSDGRPGPAELVPWLRLVEIEIHHVDLDLGYTPAHWPTEFAVRQLARTAEDWRMRDDAPAVTLRPTDDDEEHVLGRDSGADASEPRIVATGPATALLAWLVGRSDGAGLVVHPSGSGLPRLDPWR